MWGTHLAMHAWVGEKEEEEEDKLGRKEWGGTFIPGEGGDASHIGESERSERSNMPTR